VSGNSSIVRLKVGNATVGKAFNSSSNITGKNDTATTKIEMRSPLDVEKACAPVLAAYTKSWMLGASKQRLKLSENFCRTIQQAEKDGTKKNGTKRFQSTGVTLAPVNSTVNVTVEPEPPVVLPPVVLPLAAGSMAVGPQTHLSIFGPDPTARPASSARVMDTTAAEVARQQQNLPSGLSSAVKARAVSQGTDSNLRGPEGGLGGNALIRLMLRDMKKESDEALAVKAKKEKEELN
jgi:hypothetical protein